MKKRYYITTAIDYVNSLPHIGTAYEKIGADVMARFRRMDGYDVRFQMGNDEHSVNVKKAADAKGLDPQTYCNHMKGEFERVWKSLDISYDDFIQTSDPHHVKSVQTLFSKILANGDIYKSKYKGWYCESCETFLTEKDLVDGKCPNHKSRPKWLEEENYFFALSKYREKLIKHVEKNPDFILPDIRRNEVLSFLKERLDDISVSRAGTLWGISLPDDPSHVVYVWFDAVVNYIAAVGYGWDEKLFKRWWPADVHVIGKDITRFHCVLWPAMLMSAGIALPKRIFGHGFVSLKGEKMSKTLGNVVTPLDVTSIYGADPLRYYLLREGSFSRDGDFTWENFIRRYNGDLANGLGNLVARTIGMATRYLGGKISPAKPKLSGEREMELKEIVTGLLPKLREFLDESNGEVEFHSALTLLWEGMAAGDRYINEWKPWEMAKEGDKERVNSILYHLLESLRIISVLLAPFIPSTAEKVWNQLGLNSLGNFKDQGLSSIKSWGAVKKEIVVSDTKPLFPRIEEKEKEIKMSNEKEAAELIDITDFTKIDLRVAEVVGAERVDGADKLLKVEINLGGEKRQIVAGIAKHYTPDELVGKKIVVVANLRPVKLRGVESQGMLLAASDSNTISILTPLKDVEIGSKVK